MRLSALAIFSLAFLSFASLTEGTCSDYGCCYCDSYGPYQTRCDPGAYCQCAYSYDTDWVGYCAFDDYDDTYYYDYDYYGKTGKKNHTGKVGDGVDREPGALAEKIGATSSKLTSTTSARDTATTTSSTAFSPDMAPPEGSFVNCGGHYAKKCKDCHATSSNWCNGDCSWDDDTCGPATVPYASAENKTTNAKIPADGIAGPVSEKPPPGTASKQGSTDSVSCGGHSADTCRECHSSDPNWCNDDCTWWDGLACVYKDTGVFAKEVLIATNQHRASQGKRALRLDSTLTASAQDWADKLKDWCEFEHRPTGQWPSKARAENIASRCEWTPPGSDPVFDNWKNSHGHNVNMLGDHTVMGVGIGQSIGCSAFCRTTGNQAEQPAAVVVAMYG